VRERGRAIERWRRIGRLLPTEVRERVFEPAYEDLARAWLGEGAGGSGRLFGPRALSMLFLAAVVTVPRLILDRRRILGFAKVVVWSAIVTGSLLVIVLVALRPFLAYEG